MISFPNFGTSAWKCDWSHLQFCPSPSLVLCPLNEVISHLMAFYNPQVGVNDHNDPSGMHGGQDEVCM